MNLEKISAIAGITILGCVHLYTVGNGTVLGILIGALTTIAGVSIATKDKT